MDSRKPESLVVRIHLISCGFKEIRIPFRKDSLVLLFRCHTSVGMRLKVNRRKVFCLQITKNTILKTHKSHYKTIDSFIKCEMCTKEGIAPRAQALRRGT